MTERVQGMKKILDWNKYKEKATEAVAEGCVLLKNDNQALPLALDRPVAVFGRIQLDYYKSGTGSGGMVNVSEVISIPDGLKRRGATIDETVLAEYQKWTKQHPFERGTGWGGEPWCQEEMPLSEESAVQAATRCETALVVIGRTAGEEMDNSYEEGSYLLNAGEKEMLRIVRKAFHKLVVVLNVAAIVDMGFVDDFHPDAVLYAWHGGMVGGLGTADVLLGRITPSGKLTDTIAYRIEDYPSHLNFGDRGSTRDYYCEDIFVGYRYFETFAKDKVRYPFGYGLSYTDFTYGQGALDAQGFLDTMLSGNVSCKHTVQDRGTGIPEMKLTISVTNTGHASGKEIVQIYCEAPQGVLGKPSRVLCGFAKTKTLAPGEKQELVIGIDPFAMASYDDRGTTGHPYAYLLEAGEYHFYVGGNIRDAKKSVSIVLDELVVLRQVTSALAPVSSFQRMCNRNGRLEKEEVPGVNNGSINREADIPEEIAYTGDRGIVLSDVACEKAGLDEFIAQLSKEDLVCITRGEGMGSPKVTAGTAAAFGGVSSGLVKYGIPCGCCSDGPSGMRLDCGTKAFSLPGGTMLACTWNRELLTELFDFTGLEMCANQVECLLGPGMNIHRHPLNGRNFEYFSEDPLLTGEIAAAELIGLHREGVTGTIKHFCGNNRETNRHFLDSVISERALREIYLRGFEIAVKKGGAYTVMTTYGSLNGLWTAGNYELNTTILRREWGFEGLVMTDWWANINRRGAQPDKRDLAAMVMAQNDLYMVCADSEHHDDNLIESLEKGELKRAELQRSAKNILKVLLRSNAMKRVIGTAPVIEIIGRSDEGMTEQANVPCYRIADELRVDLGDVTVSRGGSYSFILDLQKVGQYRFILTASSTAGELAQIPVTIFSMGTAVGTFTWNGTGGECKSFEGSTYLFSRYTTIRLFFAQDGLTLDSITFKHVDEEAV